MTEYKNKKKTNNLSSAISVPDPSVASLFSGPITTNKPIEKNHQMDHNHLPKQHEKRETGTPKSIQNRENLNKKQHSSPRKRDKNQQEIKPETKSMLQNETVTKPKATKPIAPFEENNLRKDADKALKKQEILEKKEDEKKDEYIKSPKEPNKNTGDLSKILNFIEDDLTDDYGKMLEEKVQNTSENILSQDDRSENNGNGFSTKPENQSKEEAEKDEKREKETIGQLDKRISETKISSLESEALNKINKEFVSKTRRTATLFENLIELLDANYPDKITINEIFRTIISCEQALRDNRSFAIYCSEMVKKELQKGELADEEALKVSYENIFEDIYCHEINPEYAYFRLPELATKRNFRNNVPEMIADFSNRNYIQNALREYQNKNCMPLWKEFTFVFIHYFDENNKWIRDTDNYNTKTIIDAFLDLLITDDTSKCSHIVQLTMPVKYEAFTEVYVLKGHYLGETILKYLPRLSEKCSETRSAK